jgi:hypothetical protein
VTKEQGLELAPGIKIPKVGLGHAIAGAAPSAPDVCEEHPGPGLAWWTFVLLDMVPLYPSIPQSPNHAQGMNVFTAPYCFQRDEEYWPRALEFLPERFLPVGPCFDAVWGRGLVNPQPDQSTANQTKTNAIKPNPTQPNPNAGGLATRTHH